MNEHQLRCFVAAARYLNFTKAAQDLFLTQAAITYQVNELEKSLGVRLFDRTKEGLVLTAAGRSLQASAERILGDLVDARERAIQADHGEGRLLRLGCYGDVMHPFLPAILKVFRERCPEVKVTLRQALARELVESLNRDELDLLFMTGYGDYAASHSWIERAELFVDTHVAVVPNGHPLASADSVTFEELSAIPKISLAEKDLLVREEHTDADENTELLSDPQSVRILVDAGYGVSISVRHVAQYYDPYSTLVPIVDSSMPIYACWKKGSLSEAGKELVSLTQDMVPELLEE